LDILQATGLTYLLPFLFIITVVVFFHELGHFWVARKCGVRVEVFSIGFGRALFSWVDKHNTIWKIGWLPLGGYVKFFGDENAASNPDAQKLKAMPQNARQDIFHFKPLWQRAAIVAAGPFANFLLAIVIFAGMYTILGQQIATPIVDQVVEASAAERAGFLSGDVVVAIDNKKIKSFSDIRRKVAVSAGKDILFTVERGGLAVDLIARPDLIEETDRFGNQYHIGRLGITGISDPSRMEHVRYDPITSVWLGVRETGFIIEQTFIAIGRIIAGREKADALGGPIRIAQISGQMASLGIIALLNLTAIISVSIGLINLFPIPMLDGGHLLFYGYEAIFRRPMPEKVQAIGMRIGLALVVTLFVFVTWNDLARINPFSK